MAIHTFICDNCEISIKDTNTKIIHKCPVCGGDMRWDLHFNGGQTGDYEHISQSLAISPKQIADHKKLFPNVDVLPDGRIRFTSFKQHNKYINRCGFYKHEKKLKPKNILPSDV